jgi:hypothetical protein
LLGAGFRAGSIGRLFLGKRCAWGAAMVSVFTTRTLGSAFATAAAFAAVTPGRTNCWPTARRPSGRLLALMIVSTGTP